MEFKIKPEKLEKWKKAVGNNCCDAYSWGVVWATCDAFEALDDGKTCKEVEDAAFKGKGITGFMAGAAASWIAEFHERGEEFREYWNAQFSDEKREGTINPAIITLKDKQ